MKWFPYFLNNCNAIDRSNFIWEHFKRFPFSSLFSIKHSPSCAHSPYMSISILKLHKTSSEITLMVALRKFYIFNIWIVQIKKQFPSCFAQFLKPQIYCNLIPNGDMFGRDNYICLNRAYCFLSIHANINIAFATDFVRYKSSNIIKIVKTCKSSCRCFECWCK